VVPWKRRRLDEDDLQEEIRSHLKMAADDRVADGADPRGGTPWCAERLRNVAHTREAAGRIWTPWWLELLHDQRARPSLPASRAGEKPGVLAHRDRRVELGVGLNATVFTMLKSMAIAPLAGVAGSAKLAVRLRETTSGRANRFVVSGLQYVAPITIARSPVSWDRASRPSVSARAAAPFAVAEARDRQLLPGPWRSRQRGRVLLPSDEVAPGQNPSSCSAMAYGGAISTRPRDRRKAIEINSYPRRIVGVADATFHGTTVVYDVEVYIR